LASGAWAGLAAARDFLAEVLMMSTADAVRALASLLGTAGGGRPAGSEEELRPSYAEAHEVPTHAGSAHVFVDKHLAGRPLVIAYGPEREARVGMRALFEDLRLSHPVFGVELTGLEPLAEVLEMSRETDPDVRGAPDVVTLGQTSAAAVRVMADRPHLLRSVAMIAPTGFERPSLLARRLGFASERASALAAFDRTMTVPSIVLVSEHHEPAPNGGTLSRLPDAPWLHHLEHPVKIVRILESFWRGLRSEPKGSRDSRDRVAVP
jgi:hypothetical protein